MWQVLYLWLLSGFSFSFWQLIMVCLGVGLFEFILLVVSWVFWCLDDCFSLNLGEFLVIYSTFFFSLSHYVYVLICLVESLRYLLFFPSVFFFFFCFSVDNLNWPIFKFSDSFSCWFRSAAETLKWIFHFSYCTFQLQNFFSPWFLFIGIFYLLDINLILFFRSLDMNFL